MASKKEIVGVLTNLGVVWTRFDGPVERESNDDVVHGEGYRLSISNVEKDSNECVVPSRTERRCVAVAVAFALVVVESRRVRHDAKREIYVARETHGAFRRRWRRDVDVCVDADDFQKVGGVSHDAEITRVFEHEGFMLRIPSERAPRAQNDAFDESNLERTIVLDDEIDVRTRV